MILDPLNGKKIIVGVTGGIAAYKSCFLVRKLVSRGAEVKVVMTPSAVEFITPLTLSTLSGNDVIVNTFPPSQLNGTSLNTWHIDLALWADLMIIAPATVNTVAKISHGFADNALTTVASALRGKMLIAPAADMDMYNNPINIDNLEKLKSIGVQIVEAETGFLASGLAGPGRMAEIDKIIDAAEILSSGYSVDFENKRILVTAGPTLEDIDPVRFIGNRSSGVMGYQIAKAAFLRGAQVTLISGPVEQYIYPEIGLIKIRSASELKQVVIENLDNNDILIMAAAVADYKPVNYAENKIKKEDDFSNIPLTKNEDILFSIKDSSILKVGFALETENEIINAERKLNSKNLDLIVLKSIRDEGAGFEKDTNKVTFLVKKGNQKNLPLNTKFQIANSLLSEVKGILDDRL